MIQGDPVVFFLIMSHRVSYKGGREGDTILQLYGGFTPWDTIPIVLMSVGKKRGKEKKKKLAKQI